MLDFLKIRFDDAGIIICYLFINVSIHFVWGSDKVKLDV